MVMKRYGDICELEIITQTQDSDYNTITNSEWVEFYCDVQLLRSIYQNNANQDTISDRYKIFVPIDGKGIKGEDLAFKRGTGIIIDGIEHKISNFHKFSNNIEIYA